MTQNCPFCHQKAAFFSEKLAEIRKEAIKTAINEQKQLTIWKEGPIYKYGTDDKCPAGAAIEYVSQHSTVTT